MNALAQETIAQALKDLGVHEQGGNNRGKRVEEMLHNIGLQPGDPWCCAAICTWLKQAVQATGIQTQVHFGASVRKLWDRNQALVLDAPEPGCLALRNEGLSPHGNAIGHVMLVLDVLDDGQTIKVISGNTNAAGSREGNCVAIQLRPTSQITDNGYGWLGIQ